MAALDLHDVDPFDLPDWLGDTDVTWVADDGVHGAWRVPGRLRAAASGDDLGCDLGCDLVAVDLAYPEPVVPDVVRVCAHQAWQHGEILLQGEGDRILLAVPGSELSADVALDAVSRLARAVGAAPARYAVHLQIGRERR